MNKREKKFQTQLPGGIGANVVDGDLNLAIRVWKQELKNSGKLKTLYQSQEFKSKGQRRKEELDRAKYRNQFEHKHAINK